MAGYLCIGVGDDTFRRCTPSSAFAPGMRVSRTETDWTQPHPRAAVRDPKTGLQTADCGLRLSPYNAPMQTTYRGRQAVSIENDDLRVTVLRGGGHLAEIFDKRAGVNPLWTP